MNGADLYFAPLADGSNNGGTSPAFTSSNVAVVPLSCTISQMSVGGLVTYAGSAETATFTLYYGTSGVSPTTASNITCTTSSIAGSLGSRGGCTDNTHTLSVSQGEMLSLREHLSNENYNTESSLYWTVHLTCF